MKLSLTILIALMAFLVWGFSRQADSYKGLAKWTEDCIKSGGFVTSVPRDFFITRYFCNKK